MVRQLNFYYFKKVGKERSSFVYQHDAFQYNRPDLLVNLVRKKPASSQLGANPRGPYSSSTNSTRGRLYAHGLSIPQMDVSLDDDEASSPSSTAQYGEVPRQAPHIRLLPHQMPLMAPLSLSSGSVPASSYSYSTHFSPTTASGLGEEDGMHAFEDEEDLDDDADEDGVHAAGGAMSRHAASQRDHRGVWLSSDHSSQQRERSNSNRQYAHQPRPSPNSSSELVAAAGLRTWDAALRYFGTPNKRSPDHRQSPHAPGSQSALGSLAPSCGVSSAVLVVAEFCLAHDPWVSADGLYSQVSALLSCEPALTEELGEYVSAMFPDELSPLSLTGNTSAGAGSGAGAGGKAVCDSSTDRDSTSSGSVGGTDSPSAASSANRADKDNASVSGDSDITDESDAATLCASRVSSSSSSRNKRPCEYRVGGERRKARRTVGGGAAGSPSGGVNEVFVVRSFVSFAISCLETLSGLVLDKAQALSSQGNDSSHADKLLSDLSGVQGSWVDYAKTYST